MTSTSSRRLAATTLAVGILGAAAGPALASPSNVKPKLGTYKGRESTGRKIALVVGPCSDTGKSICVYTPDGPGSTNQVELICKGLNGAGDGLDDFSYFGPKVLPPSGTIKTKGSDVSFGDHETRTFSLVVSAKGTITGTARLTASFPDGARCDSGTVRFSVKR